MTTALPLQIDASVATAVRAAHGVWLTGRPLPAHLRATTDGSAGDDSRLFQALCVGGVDFACWLAAAGVDDHGDAAMTARHAALTDAFVAQADALESATPQARSDAERALAEAFGLTIDPATLLDRVRAELIVAFGQPQDLPQASLTAIRLGRWDLALRGFDRLHAALQGQTPAAAHGMAAICLHKLGRLDEAERRVALGLGPQAKLLAIGPAHDEDTLLARWQGRVAPVVSIVCTTYNHARYIDSALRGFVSQVCDFPFEILVHDDASTDGTQDVLRAWQARYPRLMRTVLQTHNQYSRGVRPFELLLAQARGDFVATCEGDDFWVDPQKLQRQVSFLQANPEFACSAHNYYHFVESSLTVKPWTRSRTDHVLPAVRLRALQRLLWLPTLVFRKHFTAMPPERALSPIGDQFLTSYLGTFGPCAFFDGMLGAVRRENEFSSWSPLAERDKERIRVTAWSSLVKLHRRLGFDDAVQALHAKIDASPLDDATKREVLASMDIAQPTETAEAPT